MTRKRLLAGWLLLLGGLSLAGCAGRKGDLGAVFLEGYSTGPTEYAEAESAPPTAVSPGEAEAKASAVEVAEIKPTEVSMASLPPIVIRAESLPPPTRKVHAAPPPENVTPVQPPAAAAVPVVAKVSPVPEKDPLVAVAAPENVPAPAREPAAIPVIEKVSPAPDKAVVAAEPAPAREPAAIPVIEKVSPAPDKAVVAAEPAPVAAAVPVLADAGGPTRGETGGAVGAPVADGPVVGGEKKDPPPAPGPPVAETPEQRAERLLNEAQKVGGVATQARVAEADAEYQAGLKLLNDLEYMEAREHLENAVRLNPANARAQDALRTVRALLGVRLDRMAEKLRSLEREERVRIQEQIVVLTAALEEARGYEEKGSAVDISVADSGKEQILADQLLNLNQAQAGYRRVKEILNWMPPQIELPAERRMVDEAVTRAHKKIADKEDEISFLRRQQAQRIAEDQRVRETELFRQRMRKLLEQVAALYHQGQYTAAEKLALRVLQLDPLNNDADAWKRKARAAYHESERADSKEDYAEALRTTWEAGEQSHIPYSELLVYPPNWDEITKRSERAGAVGKRKVEEAWKTDIRAKLQRRVTFEFVDTPLAEAIAFLRSLTNVNMIIDPKVLEGGPPAINLRVTDMSLDLALGWILRLADLDYALKDKAIYISKRTSLQEDVELRIYDVSDLTLTIQDFPGPDLQVQTVDPTDTSVAGGVNNPFQQAAATPQVTAASIKDMIRLHVKPDSWDPQQGTSIDERSGKLVVMQRPEVHALIDQLLANFRATQKILVNVEARFLLLRESNTEQIGVEWSGLDPYYSMNYGNYVDKYGRQVNGVTGDFGDLRNVLGVQQPRTTAANSIPEPGFTSAPHNMKSSLFSTVGSIVTHYANFSGDQDTVAGAAVQNGGLGAQLTVLNDPQYQAFLRAVAVRENASTLMTPRLTVYNTQRAHMYVAHQRSYIADYEISGDAYDPTIRQFLTGVVLDVRPTVSSDRKYVTMEIRPSQVEFDGLDETILIVPIIVSSGGFALVYTVVLPIQFPMITIRRVRTTTTVPDGGIMFIGGLYRNVRFTSENGVPFLSDLPVVGRLFRWNIAEKGRSNLAILVTPKIILFNEEEAKL